LRNLGVGKVIPGFSTVGGGSLPEEVLPTALLSLDILKPNDFVARLRKENPPIIARVENDKVVLDPRTVLPDQDDLLLKGIKHALQK
jgi:L-seryl-tRNA(Ser) seleniumtransferase